MKSKVALAVGVLALIGAIALNLHSAAFSAAQKEQPAVKIKWEYKRVTGPVTEADLNKLGEDGWDLIKVEPKIPYTKYTYAPIVVAGQPPPNPVLSTEFLPEVLFFKRAK
jgi:hypothetical protein